MSVLSNTGIRAGASAAGGDDKIYVEDVFSTQLWTGTGNAFAVNNGIDLAGEGGVSWVKPRNNTAGAENGQWVDTVRFVDADPGGYDVSGALVTESSAQASGSSIDITDFTSTGFNIGATTGEWNKVGREYVNWTFRKAPGFFDIVTYEGNATNRNIAHNLGCVPGMMFIKKTSDTGSWYVYHKSIGNDMHLVLNVDNDDTGSAAWNDTTPTSTHFTLGSADDVNKDDEDFVAYLFADGSESDAQVFGDDEDESIIKMGTFTTDASQNATVTGLGWEPQWVMFKRTSSTGDWRMHDNMRNMAHNGYALLRANTGDYEASHATVTVISATPDGFKIQNTNASSTYAYIAIRRGPMKTPTDATKVFAIDTGNASATIPAFDSGFPVDFALRHSTDASGNNSLAFSRLQGVGYLYTRLTNSEFTGTSTWDSNVGYDEGTGLTSTYIAHMFRRAPGFFDVVCYEGTGSARTLDHNLGVIPELVVVKNREGNYAWSVYVSHLSSPRTKKLHWTSNDAEDAVAAGTYWGNSDFTSTQISLGSYTETNQDTKDMIAYLFASCPGVSKIGSYEGTGSAFNIDCGFDAGARFVLIKCTSSSGNWMIYDSTRGIVSGNDPYVRLNSGDGQTTDEDHIDPHTGGFGVTTHADVNTDDEDYIYLAIA